MIRTKSLALVTLLVACGGSGGVDIDGGNDGGGGNDGSVPDGSGPGNDGGTTDGGSTDGGSTDGGNGDGSTFNVANVNGLVLWLEGDVSTSITQSSPDAGTQSITVWADQTSHHNDAKGLTAPQGLGRNPTVKTNAIHGLDAVHFNQGTGNVGNMLTIADNADDSLQWGTGDFYVAIVGDFDNDPTKGANLGVGNFFSKAAVGGTSSITGVSFYGNVPATNTNPTAGLYFQTQSTVNNFASTATAYNDGADHLFAFRRQGVKLDLYVDGTSVASTTSTGIDVSTPGSGVRIGADGDATLVRLDGDIGEVIAVKGTLAGSDQSGIEGYLKAKWATP